MPASEGVAISPLEGCRSDLANQRIVVRRCGYLYGSPGTRVTTREAQKYRNRSVSNLGTRIRFDDPAQHRYDIGDTELHGATLFAGQPMECQLSHRRDRVIERSEERVRRCVVRVVVQEEQTCSPHPWIGVVDAATCISERGISFVTPCFCLVRQCLPTVEEVVDPF
jgi:hypothetical protein